MKITKLSILALALISLVNVDASLTQLPTVAAALPKLLPAVEAIRTVFARRAFSSKPESKDLVPVATEKKNQLWKSLEKEMKN